MTRAVVVSKGSAGSVNRFDHVVETSLSEALEKLLTCPEYADLFLKGKGGHDEEEQDDHDDDDDDDLTNTTVPAPRCLLAARSRVFHKMLYGCFAEATKNTIELPFSSVVLSALVKYICTDQIPEFRNQDDPEDHEQNNKLSIIAKVLMGLMDAGAYFELPNLVEKTRKAAVAHVLATPRIAVDCLCFAESPQSEDFAMSQIRENASECLVNNDRAIRALGELKLRNIVQDPGLDLYEIEIFEMIVTWVRYPHDADTAMDPETNPRYLQGCDLARHITLENIDPDDLGTVVASSKLVSDKRLLDAFKAQAVMAARRHGVSYMESRSPSWTNDTLSSLPSTHVLHCQPLRNGVHKWKLRIEEKHYSGSVWVGVASSEHRVDCNQWIGSEKGGVGWVYGSNGTVCHKSTVNISSGLSAFGLGSVISLTLDLTKQGTLSASVDNGDTFLLFSDMLQAFEQEVSIPGFVPTVSMIGPGKVRFLGFQEYSRSTD